MVPQATLPTRRRLALAYSGNAETCLADGVVRFQRLAEVLVLLFDVLQILVPSKRKERLRITPAYYEVPSKICFKHIRNSIWSTRARTDVGTRRNKRCNTTTQRAELLSQDKLPAKTHPPEKHCKSSQLRIPKEQIDVVARPKLDHEKILWKIGHKPRKQELRKPE